MLFVRPHKPLSGSEDEGNDGYAAWAYVGSANLSESAWGRLVKDGTTKQPKLNIRNWECGIVIPVPMPMQHQHSGCTKTQGKEKKADKWADESQAGPPSMDVFLDVIPVPMIVPGEEYGGGRPWLYTQR
jgi:hypothetical protein